MNSQHVARSMSAVPGALISVVLLVSCAEPAPIVHEGPLVSARVGTLGGTSSEDGLRVFRGIRYGRAQRFHRAVPVERLRGRPFLATAAGPSCPQRAQGGTFGEQTQDEDCLWLNVWAPEGAVDLPVMVYLHGGGFRIGGANDPRLDGAAFAREGVVMVTLNYRLGALGYLDLSRVLGPEYAESADLGIYDQILALEWIQRNISAFGGDPDNVTVFGESAGAASVAHLLTTEEGSGLFARAILQSGALNLPVDGAFAQGVTERFLAHAGLDAETADQLLLLSTEEVMAIQEALFADALLTDAIFSPRIDGSLHATVPAMDALRAGSAAGVDLIIGTTKDEAAFYAQTVPLLGSTLATPETVALLLPYFRKAASFDIASARRPYDEADPDATHQQVLLRMMTDALFRVPAERLADAQRVSHGRVWFYRFDWSSPLLGGIGAPHAIELPFLFDTYETRPNLITAPYPVEVGDAMRAHWVAFARTGEPNADGLTPWPEFGADGRTMHFDETNSVTARPNPAQAAVWTRPFDGLDPSLTVTEIF